MIPERFQPAIRSAGAAAGKEPAVQMASCPPALASVTEPLQCKADEGNVPEGPDSTLGVAVKRILRPGKALTHAVIITV